MVYQDWWVFFFKLWCSVTKWSKLKNWIILHREDIFRSFCSKTRTHPDLFEVMKKLLGKSKKYKCLNITFASFNKNLEKKLNGWQFSRNMILQRNVWYLFEFWQNNKMRRFPCKYSRLNVGHFSFPQENREKFVSTNLKKTIFSTETFFFLKLESSRKIKDVIYLLMNSWLIATNFPVTCCVWIRREWLERYNQEHKGHVHKSTVNLIHSNTVDVCVFICFDLLIFKIRKM